MHLFQHGLTYDLLKDSHLNDITNDKISFFYQSYKTNRFYAAVGLTVVYQRRRQNVVRTSVKHSAAPRELLFCFHHNLTASVIDYKTDAQHH